MIEECMVVIGCCASCDENLLVLRIDCSEDSDDTSGGGGDDDKDRGDGGNKDKCSDGGGM